MPKLSHLVLAGLALFAAQLGVGAELRIDKIEFNEVDQPGVRDPWYEVALTFTIVRGDEGPGAAPRFADDLAVKLSLAIRREGSEQRLAYYEATAEYPTLEVGRHVTRFYLTPSVAKRDRVDREPYAFVCEVVSQGETVASIVSRNLEDDQALNRYRALADAESAANWGVLRLQQETPFLRSNVEKTPNPRLRLGGTRP